MAQTLNEEFVAWLEQFNLAHLEADVHELLMAYRPILSDSQITWLEDFEKRWEDADEVTRWGEPDPTQTFRDADEELLRYAI